MPDAPTPGSRVLLVDGTCVFCNRLVSFILARDPAGIFHFAHLQGAFGRAALARHGADPDDVDGVYLLCDPNAPTERLLVDGAAGREIWPRFFRAAVVLRLVPLVVLNAYYRFVARFRYSLFGRYETCHVPDESERARFVRD